MALVPKRKSKNKHNVARSFCLLMKEYHTEGWRVLTSPMVSLRSWGYNGSYRSWTSGVKGSGKDGQSVLNYSREKHTFWCCECSDQWYVLYVSKVICTVIFPKVRAWCLHYWVYEKADMYISIIYNAYVYNSITWYSLACKIFIFYVWVEIFI